MVVLQGEDSAMESDKHQIEVDFKESLCLDEGREEQLAVGVELGPSTPGGCP